MKKGYFATAACMSVVVACGARSGFEGLDDPGPSDNSSDIADGGANARLDAGAVADAAPPGPCHLTLTGEPFQSIAFPDNPYSFRQDGLLLRTAMTSPTSNHRVIQYGNVDGIRTGGWDDPAIYAAEYDVTDWPPTAVHPPTQLFDSMHDPADLIELPNNKLALTWWFDNDGLGPQGVEFRTLDATSWALDPNHLIEQDRSGWLRPKLTKKEDLFGSGYAQYTYSYFSDGGLDVTIDSWFQLFGLDGTPTSSPAIELWKTGAVPGTAAGVSLADMPSDLFIVVTFPTCEPNVTSAYCTSNSIVILRVADPNANPILVDKVATIPVQDSTKAPQSAYLTGDGAGHAWLTWWEVSGTSMPYLYGMPMTDSATPAGPVESWFVSDERFIGDEPGYILQTGRPSLGQLGLVYPVTLAVPVDGGTQREVHLFHRQLVAEAPIEDLTFTTAYTGFPMEVVQIAQPRTLIVGYSNYPPDNSYRGFGELEKFSCMEDVR